MKTFLHILMAAALAQAAIAEVKVTVGDISDKRTTGKFFAGLEIVLNISGPELAEAKGIRTTVKDATDDAGKALKKTEDRFGGDGFAELEKAFGGGFGDKKADEFQVKLEFENPPRAAKAIKSLNGSIELLVPSKDPAAVITASVAKDAGKPLENATLKAAGVQFTLRKPGKEEKKESALGFGGGGLGETDLGYVISDPKGKVASVEFFDAAGKKLESNGRMSSGFNDSKTVTITLRDKPPADAVAKIYVVTDKSVVTVPLALKDVALP
jgi:hypothetical protein